MFFLIPLVPFAAVASSAITAETVTAGISVAVSAGAFAAKKIADRVEEKNHRNVASANQNARDYVNQVQMETNKEKRDYKADKKRLIAKQLNDCNMKESDKQLCASRLSNNNNREIRK
jgi:hypothetical protein